MNNQRRLLKFINRIGRGDPAEVFVSSPALMGQKPPTEPSVTIKDNAVTLVTAFKALGNDKDVSDLVDAINKQSSSVQKTFDKFGQTIIKKLGGKEDGENLLKQAKIKDVSDAFGQMGKSLQSYADIGAFVKSLYEQVRKENKSKPPNHEKKKEKIEIKPKEEKK